MEELNKKLDFVKTDRYENELADTIKVRQTVKQIKTWRANSQDEVPRQTNKKLKAKCRVSESANVKEKIFEKATEKAKFKQASTR